jgi:hypothetical protein
MSGRTRLDLRGKTFLGLILAAAILLVTVTACQDLTSTSPIVSAMPDAGTSTSALSATGESTAEGAEATTTETASAEADTSTAGEPDFYLDKDDFGHEVRLQVGERVRIDLTVRPNEKVVSVEWRYEPIIVRQIDSGTTEVDGVVTKCWLELEAVAAGHVTVRTIYERSDDTTKAAWVIYLAVAE